ncbi:MAG: septal ring lytic transglycosylase RlpA family protein [Candidatus Korobacteraceae bacterium]|jgi:peptidoglycan lytic transglycosylase
MVLSASNAGLPHGLKPGSFAVPRGTPEGVPFQVATANSSATRAALVAFVAAGLLLLAACGGHKTARSQPVPPPPTITAPQPEEPSTASTEPAPTVPRNTKPIYVETGRASWYGPPYHHRRGANGEIYNEHAMTAAHRTLPMNSMVRVTNLSTGRSAMVRITDRGPFVEDRIIDLSLAAAKAVDVWQPGTAEVKLEVLSAPAPILEGGRWCVQIGAFHSESEARKLKERLQDRYEDANVIQFTGPTGEWVRIRPEGDDKRKAQEVASKTHVKEGGVFLVRLD